VAADDPIDVWQVTARDRGAGHAQLRAILGSYVDVDPAAIAFVHGAQGKPALAGHDIEFSYTRSGNRALVAVSRRGPLGVDVERLKPGRAIDRIARRRFAPAEVAAIAGLDGDRQNAAFHQCWTAKEAYAKGVGAGLTMGLATFSVAGLLGREGRCQVNTWAVRRLPAPPGYAAALAAPGSGWRFRLRFPGDRDG
jgi:4'-phosphopantetheinyl transferase